MMFNFAIIIKNNSPMNNKKTIGELIENEVRKQQIPIVGFAKMICCKRNNVYDIFKRNKIDIVQLKRISKVLNRNFFKELANDLDLIDEKEESEEERIKQKAVSQFLEVVPDILSKLGRPPVIVFCKLNEPGYEDCDAPDFILRDQFITFTIGDTLKERIGDNPLLQIAQVHDGSNGSVVEVCTNNVDCSTCINVKIDNKTYDEWYNVMVLAFETYSRFGRF